MRHLALSSLFHDRARFLAALAGVTFAAILVFTQVGLYCGFLFSVTSVIDHAGGDLWVVARGVETIDNAELLSAGTRAAVESQPCVERVRPLVFQRTTVRKLRTGGLQSARVVGVDIGPNVPTLPWDTVVGLPSDLRAPMRTSVDTTAFERLQLPRDPVGTQLDVRGQRVTVAVVTHAIRSSSTLPYLFTTPESARRMSGMPADSTNVWLVDLQNPACAASVAGSISAVPGLQAMSRAAFKARTERYWLTSTGVGASLTYVAIMALVVGTMIVGQTLYSLAGDHARELATLRALGRRRRELFGFVGWQAALLAVTGIGLGYAISAAVRVLSRGTKLTIVLPPEAALLGIGALLAMCLFASLLGARRVMTLDPAMVFA